MTANLRLQLYGFKGAYPTFPDETTVNQFFSEAWFEAYREPGWDATDQMLTALANSSGLAGWARFCPGCDAAIDSG